MPFLNLLHMYKCHVSPPCVARLLRRPLVCVVLLLVGARETMGGLKVPGPNQSGSTPHSYHSTTHADRATERQTEGYESTVRRLVAGQRAGLGCRTVV